MAEAFHGGAAAPTAPMFTDKPRHSLPHPPMFSGTKSQWRGWKLEMEGKIEEDAAAIGNPKSQLRYIYSRLEGAAKINITTFHELELRKPLPNPQSLIERLDILYRERNRKEKAIQSLHNIRQREEESFTAFYPRFEKEIANAEAESWEDSSKISYLRNALHQKLKTHLIGITSAELNTYVAFATKCEEISNQMELFGEWKPHAGKNSTLNQREDMMEWEPTSAVYVNTARIKKNISGYPSKRPEDQTLIGKRAKWVEKSELIQRREEGRCLRCGRDGCRIERCPLAAAIPPLSRAQVNTIKSRPQVTEAAIAEEEEGFSDS